MVKLFCPIGTNIILPQVCPETTEGLIFADLPLAIGVQKGENVFSIPISVKDSQQRWLIPL